MYFTNTILAMASEKKIIQPVWGMSRRKVSTAMLDTAETLVENLDDISDVLDQLTEKYEKVSQRLCMCILPILVDVSSISA